MYEYACFYYKHKCTHAYVSTLHTYKSNVIYVCMNVCIVFLPIVYITLHSRSFQRVYNRAWVVKSTARATLQGIMFKCTIHMSVCCMYVYMRVGKGSASLILHTFFSSQTLQTLFFLAIITYLSHVHKYINICMYVFTNQQRNICIDTYINFYIYL